MMKKGSFDEVLARYLDGTLPPDEVARVEAWLDQVKTAQRQGLTLSPEEEERLFARIEAAARPHRPAARAVAWPRVARLAAAAAFVVLASAAVWYYGHLRPSEVRLQAQALPDGTVVWMRPGGTLHYTDLPHGQRHVQFEGEALFEVAKDAKRPFVVACGGSQVQVLGTSFRLQASGSEVDVDVLTGRVQVTARDSVVVLRAGEHAHVADLGVPAARPVVDSVAVQLLVAVTDYALHFEHEPLDAVVARLSRKFGLAIEVREADAGRCRVTADFTDRSLLETLALLKEVLDITYEIKDGVVVIAGSGC